MAVESSTNLSLVSRRNRREEDHPDSSEPEPSHESINKLTDPLLFGNSSSDSNPFTLMLQYMVEYPYNQVLLLPSDNSSLFKSHIDRAGLDFLNFLPYPISIEATFNDLLLVCGENLNFFNPSSNHEYYICNPITKQWLTVPPPPLQTISNMTMAMVGFICEPYSCQKEQESITITNAHYKYKVVRILSPTETNTTQLEMEIFSSLTGEWSNSVVSSPKGLNPFITMSMRAGIVTCSGKLHWVDAERENNMIKGFVVFDPFNDAERCRYINPPSELSLLNSVSFGVFQGRLQLFQLSSNDNFSVWELEDYGNAGTWCMKHKVYLKDMVSENSLLVELANEMYSNVDLLAFHPNDVEVVFLQFRNYVVLCNMRTRVLKMAGYLRNKEKSLVNNHTLPVSAKSSFLLVQPQWPTPVPPLPLDN
jgi:F-box interacting protein